MCWRHGGNESAFHLGVCLEISEHGKLDEHTSTQFINIACYVLPSLILTPFPPPLLDCLQHASSAVARYDEVKVDEASFVITMNRKNGDDLIFPDDRMELLFLNYHKYFVNVVLLCCDSSEFS